MIPSLIVCLLLPSSSVQIIGDATAGLGEVAEFAVEAGEVIVDETQELFERPAMLVDEAAGASLDETRQVAGDTVTMAGDTLTMAGDTLTRAGDTLTMAGDTLTMAGDTLTMAGDTLTRAGDTLTMAGDTLTRAGDTLTVAGDTLEVAGDAVTAVVETVLGCTDGQADNRLVPGEHLDRGDWLYSSNCLYVGMLTCDGVFVVKSLQPEEVYWSDGPPASDNTDRVELQADSTVHRSDGSSWSLTPERCGSSFEPKLGVKNNGEMELKCVYTGSGSTGDYEIWTSSPPTTEGTSPCTADRSFCACKVCHPDDLALGAEQTVDEFVDSGDGMPPRKSLPDDWYRPGHKVKIRCNDGFHVAGEADDDNEYWIECQDEGQADGQSGYWEAPKNCVPIGGTTPSLLLPTLSITLPVTLPAVVSGLLSAVTLPIELTTVELIDDGTPLPCWSNPCGLEGKCTDTPDRLGYVCSCIPAFTGPSCDVALTNCEKVMQSGESTQRKAMMGAQSLASFIIIGTMIILLIVFIIMRDFSVTRIYHMIEEASLLFAHVILLVARTPSLFDTAAMCDPVADPSYSPIKLSNETCGLVGVVLHYLYMVHFGTLFVESLHNYTCVTNVHFYKPLMSRLLLICVCLVYSLPLVAITALAFFNSYTSKTTCWIDTDSINYIIELVPMFLMVGLTVIVSEATTMRRFPDIYHEESVTKELEKYSSRGGASGGVIIPLISIAAWFINSSAVSKEELGLYTIASALCIVLAVLIAVFHILASVKVRNAIKKCCGKKAVENNDVPQGPEVPIDVPINRETDPRPLSASNDILENNESPEAEDDKAPPEAKDENTTPDVQDNNAEPEVKDVKEQELELEYDLEYLTNVY